MSVRIVTSWRESLGKEPVVTLHGKRTGGDSEERFAVLWLRYSCVSRGFCAVWVQLCMSMFSGWRFDVLAEYKWDKAGNASQIRGTSS
jgi:hypothetical protein